MHYLDSANDNAWLKNPEVAEIVQNALMHFDGERYELHAWAVMSNHVHVVVTPKAATHSLSTILHSWKSFTANKSKHSVETYRWLLISGSMSRTTIWSEIRTILSDAANIL